MTDQDTVGQASDELFRSPNSPAAGPTEPTHLDGHESKFQVQNLDGTDNSVPKVNQSPITAPEVQNPFPDASGSISSLQGSNPTPSVNLGTNPSFGTSTNIGANTPIVSGIVSTTTESLPMTQNLFPGPSGTISSTQGSIPSLSAIMGTNPNVGTPISANIPVGNVPTVTKSFPGPPGGAHPYLGQPRSLSRATGTFSNPFVAQETNINPFTAPGTNLTNSSNMGMIPSAFPKPVPGPDMTQFAQQSRQELPSESIQRYMGELSSAYNFPRQNSAREIFQQEDRFRRYEDRPLGRENRSQVPFSRYREFSPHEFKSFSGYSGENQAHPVRQTYQDQYEETIRSRRQRNRFLDQDATDAMVRTSNTWKEVKKIEETYGKRNDEVKTLPTIPFQDLSLDGGLPTVEDVVRYHFLALFARDGERNEADPNSFFQAEIEAMGGKTFGQMKNLSTPAHQLAALRGRIPRSKVTLAPTSFPGWKRYIDTLLNASYMGSLTQIKAKDVPSSPEEWNMIDGRPETWGAFYYTLEKLQNGMVPRFSSGDNIFVLNGIFRGVCNFFPNAMLILQPLLVESLDPIFNYLVKDIIISETNFRYIYFSIIKKFKGATEGIVALRIQNFLQTKYDPRNGPMAFAAELAKERVEVNDLAETEALTVSMMRTTFINAIRQKTQLFNNLLDSATFVANKSLDEIVSMLERKYLEERLTNPVHQGNFAGNPGISSGFKTGNSSNLNSKPKICYQWRDSGTCSFGKDCKWKEFHTESNKKIGKASTNLASVSDIVQNNDEDGNDDLLDQFAALATQSRARKSNAKKYKKKFKSMVAKANLLQKELSKRSGKSLQESLNLATQGKLSVDDAADIADSEQVNLLLGNDYLEESDASSISSE